MKSFRQFADVDPELMFFEQRNEIDKARIKNLRNTKHQNRLETIRQSNAHLTKEINEITQDIDSDDLEEIQQKTLIEKSKKTKKEPIEFTLLRTSVMAALSSEEEENDIDTKEEDKNFDISEKTELIKSKKDSINKSNASYIDGNSKSMNYDELLSTFVTTHDLKEAKPVIDASDRARYKLYSPYLIKNDYRQTLPTNLTYLKNYRTPKNTKTFKQSKMKSFESPRKVNTNENYSEQQIIDSIVSNSKSVYDIDGVQNHVTRLRRAHVLNQKPNDEDELVEVIPPNKPLLTPSKAEITKIIDTEMDYMIAENSK